MTKHLTNKVLQLSQTIKTVSLQDVVEVWPEISHFEFNPRNHPLVLAAGSGRADLVEFLLPFAQDYFTHKAFEVSAQREHLHVLKLFIGCVDPNGNKGQALQWAMYNKDYPMIDFLLDLVNPKDALDMMKPAWGDTDGWNYVNDAARAKASAKRLNTVLENVSALSKIRKM